MPIYEYLCDDCGRRTTIFWPSFSQVSDPRCSACGGKSLTRVISRVAIVKSEESRLDDLADLSSLGNLDESDPGSVARWMRRMEREMGEDLGDEFGEMVDRLEAGESPEDIEGSLMGSGPGMEEF